MARGRGTTTLSERVERRTNTVITGAARKGLSLLRPLPKDKSRMTGRFAGLSAATLTALLDGVEGAPRIMISDAEYYNRELDAVTLMGAPLLDQLRARKRRQSELTRALYGRNGVDRHNTVWVVEADWDRFAQREGLTEVLSTSDGEKISCLTTAGKELLLDCLLVALGR